MGNRKVKSILKESSPIMEDVGIDEVFLDISRLDKQSEEIAGEIKRRIKDEVDLSCSIGIA
jgi:DNA polymerase-4